MRIKKEMYKTAWQRVGFNEEDPCLLLDWNHKIHLKFCLDTVAEISDRPEDAVDQLELPS